MSVRVRVLTPRGRVRDNCRGSQSTPEGKGKGTGKDKGKGKGKCKSRSPGPGAQGYFDPHSASPAVPARIGVSLSAPADQPDSRPTKSDFRKQLKNGMKKSVPTMATSSKAAGTTPSPFSSGAAPKASLVFSSGARRPPFADEPGSGRCVAQFPFRGIRLAAEDTTMPPADLYGDGGGTPGGSAYPWEPSRASGSGVASQRCSASPSL